MSRPQKICQARGTAVILSISLVLLLGVLGSTALLRSLHEHQLGDRSAARQQAFFLAEAGVDQSLLNLRTPEALTDDVNTGTLPTGTFQIDSPPVSLGSLQWRVKAHGTSQSETRHIEATLQMTPQSVFQFSLFGDQQVSVSGNAQTDSYDSRLGAYDPNNHLHHGDVGTNSTATGGITVSGSIFVDGQLSVGPNVSNPQSLVTGLDPAFVTGGTSPPSDTQDVVAQSQTFPMPSVTVPSGLACADQQVQGRTTLTLSATGGPLGNGTYCFHDLAVRGGAQLTADGPVTVYLTGQLQLGGNSSSGSSPSIGVPGDPTRMRFLLSTTNPATMDGTINGSATFYGALYGPNATLTISGNAKVFGSIIAGRVSVTGNAQLHYDTALADVTQVSNLYATRLVSWREVTN